VCRAAPVFTAQDRSLLRQLQRGPLTEWAGVALRELASPLQGEVEYDDCSVPLALLRLLRLFIEHAPLALKPHAAQLLPPLGAQLQAVMRASEAQIAEDGGGMTHDDGGQCASDGGMLGLAALAAQLFDVIAALAGSSKWSKLLLPVLPEVGIYMRLPVLQIFTALHLLSYTPLPTPLRSSTARRC